VRRVEAPPREPADSAAARRLAWRLAIGFVIASLLLMTFPGRVALFLLHLIWPPALPTPLALVSPAPHVRRVAFPSPSGRRLVAEIYRPGAGRSPFPGLMVHTPATRPGLANPQLRRLLAGLARLGYVALAAFPEGHPIPYASEADLDDAAAVLAFLGRLPEVDATRTIAAGFSYGAGPLLLAIARRHPAEPPQRVLLLGGYADLEEFFRFATTGAYRFRDHAGRFPPHPYVREMATRTALAWIPADQRPRLLPTGAIVLPPDSTPLARTVVELLINRDPVRFDELYARLPRRLRERVAAMSPVHVAPAIRRPVHLLHPRDDPYVPYTESLRLWAALPPESRAQLALPGGLGHGLPTRREWRRPRALIGALRVVYSFCRRALEPPP